MSSDIRRVFEQGLVVSARRRLETMRENRGKLIAAGRKAFAFEGFSAASMDELTASVGLTRGALYHNFGAAGPRAGPDERGRGRTGGRRDVGACPGSQRLRRG